MLDVAYNHAEVLNAKFMQTKLDEKYKFYWSASWHGFDVFEPDKSNWTNIQMVSKNTEGEVLGYMSAAINRDARYVDTLVVINFSDDKYTFGKDLREFLDRLLKQFYKINFSVVIGNPIEKSYDKLVKKYNGRVVGIFEKDKRLMDGKLYDYKVYEVFSPYFKKEEIQ